MTPNIDERGAEARLKGARIILFLAGLLLFVPHIPRWLTFTLFGILLVTGLFMRFEAKKRWCVLRACGLKTPL